MGVIIGTCVRLYHDVRRTYEPLAQACEALGWTRATLAEGAPKPTGFESGDPDAMEEEAPWHAMMIGNPKVDLIDLIVTAVAAGPGVLEFSRGRVTLKILHEPLRPRDLLMSWNFSDDPMAARFAVPQVEWTCRMIDEIIQRSDLDPRTIQWVCKCDRRENES